MRIEIAEDEAAAAEVDEERARMRRVELDDGRVMARTKRSFGTVDREIPHGPHRNGLATGDAGALRLLGAVPLERHAQRRERSAAELDHERELGLELAAFTYDGPAGEGSLDRGGKRARHATRTVEHALVEALHAVHCRGARESRKARTGGSPLA